MTQTYILQAVMKTGILSVVEKRTQFNPISTGPSLNPGAPGFPMATPTAAPVFRHPSSAFSPKDKTAWATSCPPYL
jgi:hypothetical protein